MACGHIEYYAQAIKNNRGSGSATFFPRLGVLLTPLLAMRTSVVEVLERSVLNVQEDLKALVQEICATSKQEAYAVNA
eukprot:4969889-Amphidinium_carterae.1